MHSLQTFRVVGVHLPKKNNRRQAVELVWRHMEEAREDGKTVLAFGDFNTTPGPLRNVSSLLGDCALIISTVLSLKTFGDQYSVFIDEPTTTGGNSYDHFAVSNDARRIVWFALFLWCRCSRMLTPTLLPKCGLACCAFRTTQSRSIWSLLTSACLRSVDIFNKKIPVRALPPIQAFVASII